jgi:acyl carrier protein
MDRGFTEDQILKILSNIIVEALRVDPTRITKQTRIFLDLNAESIDILDIRFRMEQAFGFKINQEEMLRSIGAGLSAQEIQMKFTVGSLAEYLREKIRQQEG